MRFYFTYYEVLVFILLVELLFLAAIRHLSLKDKKRIKFIIIPGFLLSTCIAVLFYFAYEKAMRAASFHDYNFFFYTLLCFMLVMVPKAIFGLFYIIELPLNILLRLLKKKVIRFVSYIGLYVSALFLLLILYGSFWGMYDFRVIEQPIHNNQLPTTFHNFRIVQISDLHLGSFSGNIKQMKKLVAMVNSQEPDLLVFTGDLINNFSNEADEFIPVLKNLKARYGKFAILGNHDYGDYKIWDSEEQKIQNFSHLLEVFKQLDFQLLRNETLPVIIQADTINLAGVENIGHHANYGDLEKTLLTALPGKFTILLSHDPGHWAQKVKYDPRIGVTLSGHTHGFQVGMHSENISFSPASFLFPEWGGLYEYEGRFLYVNVGLGVLGMPVRIGMRPEITVITLNSY